MDFVTSHFNKMNFWPVEHFQLNTFSTYLSSLMGGFVIAISKNHPKAKSDDKYLEKVFNWSEVHLVTKSKSYCPKKYTVGGGVKSAFLNVRISTTYCDIFLFKLPIMECVSLGVCSKVYMENYKWKINRLPELLGL